MSILLFFFFNLVFLNQISHGNRSGMKFTWHYGKVTGNHSGKQAEAKAEEDFFTAVNKSAIYYDGNASGELVSLNDEAFSVNQTYLVKLVVTKDRYPPEIYQRLGIYLVFSVVIKFAWFVFTVVFVAVVNTYTCSRPWSLSLF